MQPESKMIAKVQALLAKADSTEIVEERETYAQKAVDLMAKYGIERTMLRKTSKNKKKAAEIADRKFVVKAPYAHPKVRLLAAVAWAFNSVTIVIRKDKGNLTAHVFGPAEDLNTIAWLYGVLSLQATANAIKLANTRDDRQKATKYYYLVGFADGVREQFATSKKNAVKEARLTGKEVALVEPAKLAEEAMREMYPNARVPARPKTGTGYANGYIDGKNASTGDDPSVTTAKASAKPELTT